ncbi:Myb-like DNA-binding domain protein (macronuclear) [Tetrahymena thermophila SB210]|uniref:Myb-like DNA-binding domain protein n=1 Tax=Tetrahymena thermophila (strain SB210) TaxID=312017 RepID=I7M254_TETTS|nr:Myb-like DNA-binding domain protein [Tetrahymena thermophila SB210]EAR99347.2 Myb-like DNA-binding domain protein [Tetrahymena thermophila SB210]|eukprot:XP_001019592.2 Myb-like DNA-binding domain protein [Tetrahymena thermophila SB210]
MTSRSKDTIGIQLKEKGRKRLIKPLVKSSEALEDKSDSFKCKKRPWSEEEDLLVIKLVKEHGPQKWTFIATHLEGRIGKQCRERWHNHLNPNIKKCSWSEEEEWVLYLFHKGIGNKWAEIAKYIIGRTDNSIKNHWNSGMKKRLDDYARKLINVREIFAEVGESYFDRVSLPGEKKALEILLLNKQYVPSDCDEDEEDDEEDEQSQEDNQNFVNTSTNQNINNNNSSNNNNSRNNPIVNSSKESTLKEDTDNSQKTKEKHSVNSKAQVNPFSWTKTEDEGIEKNSSTVKKIQPIPQLLKHSQSLQPTQTTAVLDKENTTFTPKSNQINTQQQNTNLSSYSQILKENKSETNKQRADKKSLRQLSPSIKEDPKKKLKLEETSPTEFADKAKKNQSQKENINPQNCKIESHDSIKGDSDRIDGKNKEYGCYQEIKQEHIKDNQYYNYCEESQQLNPNQQYQNTQLQNEDKPYPYQIYDGQQPGPYAGYPSGYHPYPLHRSQSLNGYIAPPQSSQIQQQCYSSLYTPVNAQQNVNGAHFPHHGQVYNPYSHVQAYKYDPHYYSHYQPMNFMYYPAAHPNQSQSGYPQQPYPYYKDYQYPKGQQPQIEQYPKGQQPHSESANHNRQSTYPVQPSTQNYYNNASSKYQQPVGQNHSKKEKLNLHKSISMPSQSDSQYIQEFNSNCKNASHLNNDAKKQNKENQEEQSNRNRADTKSTIYSQQMQSTQQSKNNQKEYMDMNFMQSEQKNNYLSSLNSDFKCKQLVSSPFQSKRASVMSECLQSSGKQSEEDDLESDNDQKVQRNFTNQIAFPGISGLNSQVNNQNLGINYESPSKMLNLSERVMLKTLSSNKQYIYNMNSNIKYPANRSSINPLNLNSLFNQEDEFFNENSQQLI